MALKLIKINIALEVKADTNDEDDLRDRIYDSLLILIENEELEFTLDEDEEEVEGEE